MRLLEGDCLEKMKEIESGSVDMVMTDPPYGTTACKWDTVIPLEPMWEQLKRVIKLNGAIVMTSQSLFTAKLQITSPFFRYCLIWEKTKAGGFLNANRMPLQAHEDITVHYKKLPTYNPQKITGKAYLKKAVSNGDRGNYGKFERKGMIIKNEGTRFPRSVLKFSNDNHGSLHPTQKPVALMEYFIKTYTNEGEIVLDFTMGSGTTGVACVNLNREFIGIEKDADIFNTATGRINATTVDKLERLAL